MASSTAQAPGSLKQSIATLYDESSGLWESLLSDHIHHGYYDLGETPGSMADHVRAQTRMIDESLAFAGIPLTANSKKSPKNIVDVGCGLGGSSRYMAKKYGAQCKGITLSPYQAQRASTLAAEQGLSDQVTFQVADALQQPFPDGQFDLVWSMESGEHMPDRRKFVSEMARVAAPGGTIIIVAWCHRNLEPSETSLKPDELSLLKTICDAYALPEWSSPSDYVNIAKSLSLEVTEGSARNSTSEMSITTSNTTDSSRMDDDLDSSPARARRSKVWEYFEQNLVKVDDVLKAVCKYCGMKLGTQSGTSSLRAHIAATCPAIGDDDRSRFLATMKKQPSDTFVFDPVLSRERMVQFCIHAEIPFNKFEDPYFEPWMETLQPTFKCVGRQTVRNDSLKMYERMKQDFCSEFSMLDSRVCFTSDMWTSVQNLGYLVLTAHYVDANFKLKKKIISLKEVKYPHTGYAIEEAIQGCLTEWGLREKMFTLTLDNAGNNGSAIDVLVAYHKHELLFEGAHLHVRCCAHILNILVQDGMAIIHGAIGKIRELLKNIESSPSRIQNFNSIATNMGLKAKRGVYLDVQNRWNSTFKMVQEALEYKAVLQTYASQNVEVAPNEEEWSRAEAICVFLKAFEEATNIVSADLKPTSHKFFPLVLSIRHALNDPAWQTTQVLKDLAAAMKVKFFKYWEPKPQPDESRPRKRKEYDFNVAVVIATFLDPRRKLDYVDFFYEKVCSNLDQAGIFVKSAQDWMNKYFNEYERLARKDASAFGSTSSQSSCTIGSPVLGKRELKEEFASFKSRRRVIRRPKYEVDTYLEEDPAEDSASFDVLTWWKVHAEKFPVLSKMARDFLAIPLSTVSSESAFSCCGRIVGDTRSSLTPHMLEALVCTKDWLQKVRDTDDEVTR